MVQTTYWPNRDPEMADYGDGVIAYVCYMMLLVFALGLLSAHLISRHFSSPILTLTKQVEQYSNQNRPLVNTNRSDKVGELHRAFFAAFSRIQAFLEREKQFTRFSSHELRTPVHVIGGSVQLLELSDSDERRLNILKRISDANKDMEQLINTFLFIGREQQNTQPKVSLAETLRNCITQHEYLLSGRSVDVECYVHSDEKSEVYFSKVVLANMLRNAFGYAQSQVAISLTGQRLVIVNDIAPDTESGFGHGKEIISAICHSANWRFYAAIGDSKATTVLYF
ncbi:sensor histidine kinase [Veronia nyctiphanis]|nr:HAMP domain-containing sensor histidine kinase [Veronia nyctiphanis]